jgi:hypothetical protein
MQWLVSEQEHPMDAMQASKGCSSAPSITWMLMRTSKLCLVVKTILWTVENNHPVDTLNQDFPMETFESAQFSLYRWGG